MLGREALGLGDRAQSASGGPFSAAGRWEGGSGWHSVEGGNVCLLFGEGPECCNMHGMHVLQWRGIQQVGKAGKAPGYRNSAAWSLCPGLQVKSSKKIHLQGRQPSQLR